MLTRSIIILIAVSVVAAHHGINYHNTPSRGDQYPSVEQELGRPAINPQPADVSDLKTDASTWWRSWNKWGNSYNYNYNQPAVSYSSYPTYYTTKTRYIYTPKTYTYYEPVTYTTHYTVPETRKVWVEESSPPIVSHHVEHVINDHERW